MAINDNAVLVIGAGNFFTGAVDAAEPTNPRTVSSAVWTNVGHTSISDILSMASEGGEATNIGTLQNKTLRTKYATRTESIKVTIHQFDKASLKLYYGANAVERPNGTVGVPVNPIPTVCAFLAVFIDAENYFTIYVPKAEIYRADDLSLPDTESLAALPLNVKCLQSGSNNWVYAISPLGETTGP